MKFLGMLLLPLIGGCIAAGSSHDEVARSTSPNGAIDAIVIESNGGATTSFSYDVCVAPRGGHCTVSESLVQLYGAVRNKQAYGVKAHWTNDSLVQVEYMEAERTKILQSTSIAAGRNIHVALLSGVVDPSAPPGGMLYNLQGRRQDAP